MKLREAQLQLQRKLQQRELKDQKHRHVTTILQVYRCININLHDKIVA